MGGYKRAAAKVSSGVVIGNLVSDIIGSSACPGVCARTLSLCPSHCCSKLALSPSPSVGDCSVAVGSCMYGIYVLETV